MTTQSPLSRRSLRTCLAATAAFVTLTGGAVLAPTATAAPPRPAPTFDAQDVATLQGGLDELVDAGAVGAVARVEDDTTGRTWSGAAGVRDAGKPAKAQPGDVARIASVSKAMVATLVMQEVDAGRWTLDTTVDDVVPGLLGEHGDVTLEQLLSHRSGLPDYLIPLLSTAATTPEIVAALEERRTDRELVDAALTQPWLFEPGTSYSYSNANYVVAGMMLERATGKKLANLLRQNVFKPAGMETARFPTTQPAFTTKRHIGDYGYFDGDDAPPVDLSDTSSSLFGAAGAVVASPEDVAAFYRALFAGRLVSPDSLAAMTEPRTTSPIAYGLGIYRVTDPCPRADGTYPPLYGHDGALFGTLTLAFTSADGTRRAMLSFSGRQYAGPITPTSVAANDWLVDGLLATCSTTPDAAATQRSAPQDLRTPRLSEDVDRVVRFPSVG